MIITIPLRSSIFAFAMLGAHGPVHAQAPAEIVIGAPAPLSGSSEILGRQVVAGIKDAVDDEPTEGDTRIVEADTECTAEGGARAAEQLAAEGVAVAVGFLCTAALEAALPVLSRAGIPTLDIGVRANRITADRERDQYLVWRLAPRSDAEAQAVADTLLQRWRTAPFGLVDDGSIHARGLSDTVRRLLEEEGLKPAVIDNYRPAEEKQFGLVRRMERSGVTRFFLAGDRPDIAVIARDAASLGLNLEIVAGESLLDENSIDVPLPEGVVSVGPVQHAQAKGPDASPGGGAGYGSLAAAAAEIAIAAVKRSRAENRPLPEVLNGQEFQTRLGPIRFGPKGDSDLQHYEILVWDGSRFVWEAEG